MSRIIDKDEKKKQILEAAVRVFSRKGAVGTKIEDIAREAGVAKGTVYLYFKNKEDIFRSILHLGEGGELNIKPLVDADVPVEEKIEMAINTAIKKMVNKRYPKELMPELWAALVRSCRGKSMLDEVIRLRDFIASLFSEASGGKKAMADCRISASGIMALLHGIVFVQSLDEGEFPAEMIIRRIVKALLES